MTDLTDDQVRALLDGTTPGPWEKMLGTHGRNKICATYPCINGLSALFTIADVNVPEEIERGYTDDAFNPDVAAANTGLIAAAPDLARTALDALARLEDAEGLVAALRHAITEASDPDFIWGAMDNVHDAETTLDDYAAAVSRAFRAALATVAPPADTGEDRT
ncbi:MAG: hypothetical protein C0524_20350 [Rhodobacter sp.]|nr:hypothetical protein [Rhodobacter sp.]